MNLAIGRRFEGLEPIVGVANSQVVAGDARRCTWINYPYLCLSAGGMHPHGEKPYTCLPRDHQPPDLPLPNQRTNNEKQN